MARPKISFRRALRAGGAAAIVALVLAAPGTAGADSKTGGVVVTGTSHPSSVSHPTPVTPPTAPVSPTAPGTPTRTTLQPGVTGCTPLAETGACTSYVTAPTPAKPNPAPPLYYVTGPPGHRKHCSLRSGKGTAGRTGVATETCTPTPPAASATPTSPPRATTAPPTWSYGFAGDQFEVCVHSWSVTYNGQTITQTGSPCTGRFHQNFEVDCRGSGHISASFTLAYLSSFPGWDPSVVAAGASAGLDRVSAYPAPPGFFADGTTTVSLGSATVVPRCPSAGFNTPPATESLYALGPLGAFDNGQPHLFKFEPIVRTGGHLDLPVAWLGFTSWSIGPGMDRLVPGGWEVLDSNPYEAAANVTFKPSRTNPSGSLGMLDVSFNTPSVGGVAAAPYTVSATGRFAVYWGTEFVTLSILPNLDFASPVTLRIAGTRPASHTVCTGTGAKRTCRQVIRQVPSTVDVSFLPLKKSGTVASLSSTSTFDKAHETVFSRSATASVKVYGPMLMP